MPNTIPENYTTMLQGVRFLLYDSYLVEGKEEIRMTIFTTKENLQPPIYSDTWFFDGMLLFAPSIFIQLLAKRT